MSPNAAHWLANGLVVVSAVPIGLAVRWIVFRHHREDE